MSSRCMCTYKKSKIFIEGGSARYHAGEGGSNPVNGGRGGGLKFYSLRPPVHVELGKALSLYRTYHQTLNVNDKITQRISTSILVFCIIVTSITKCHQCLSHIWTWSICKPVSANKWKCLLNTGPVNKQFFTWQKPFLLNRGIEWIFRSKNISIFFINVTPNGYEWMNKWMNRPYKWST